MPATENLFMFLSEQLGPFSHTWITIPKVVGVGLGSPEETCGREFIGKVDYIVLIFATEQKDCDELIAEGKIPIEVTFSLPDGKQLQLPVVYEAIGEISLDEDKKEQDPFGRFDGGGHELIHCPDRY